MQEKNIFDFAIEIHEALDFNKIKSKYNFSGIYCWLNKQNNKIYIGSARSIKNRFYTYNSGIKTNKKINNDYLTNAFRKYNLKEWKFLIIEKELDISILYEREQFYINLFEPFKEEKGYNILDKAGILPERIRTLKRIGENCYQSKFKNKDIYDIFNLFINGMGCTEISKIYKVEDSTISAIIHRKQWEHLEIEEGILQKAKEIIELNKKNYISKETALEIGKDLLNMQIKDICKKYNLHRGVVENINRGKRFKFIKQQLKPDSRSINNRKQSSNFIPENLKNQIINDIKNNISKKEILTKYKISRRTLNRYENNLRKNNILV